MCNTQEDGEKDGFSIFFFHNDLCLSALEDWLAGWYLSYKVI